LRRPADNLLDVVAKALVIQMGVGVNELQRHHFTLLPDGRALSGWMMARVPSGPEAASSMPLETWPLSLAGFKLATTTTCLPTKEAGSYWLLIPATICRRSPPTSTWSFNSLSAPSTGAASSTVAN